jgi:hypothetical protein
MARYLPVDLRNRGGILAHALGLRIDNRYGNVYVEVETNPGEHHMTNRAAGARFVAEHLGTGWVVHTYVGPVYYRRADGYSATARRYSVVFVG